ncbi:N-acetylglucosaminyl-phosphatidylinositol de-N-acetylase [Didymella keratinophila]|nr:N-acetylglucosaminyl-phosphatidylinositol de-N-acetylase [Didymella keratinophila]
MFFAPTLLSLTRPELGNHVKILCLSSGDADGLGETRKKELVKSGLQLGIGNKDDIHVIEDKNFPDSMTVTWHPRLISNLLTTTFAPKMSSISAKNAPEANIDAIITFDAHGVSGHPNHKSLYDGAHTFLKALMHRHSGWECPIKLYTLTTTSIFRKYASLLDAPATLITAITRKKELGNFPTPLLSTTTVVVKQVQASGRASIDLYASPLDAALADSKVYKKRLLNQPTQALGDINDGSPTFDGQDTKSTKIGDMRLELKDSPVNQPAPAQVLNPPFPQLRGGAESPDKIPPTLFWLAGGTGRKPISFSGWKQSRPKQRMGGLFGMAVFGDKYGQEHKMEANVAGDVEVECSASVKVTVEGKAGVKEAGIVADTSTSSTSSSASSKGASVEEVAAVAEEAEPKPVVEPVQRAIMPSKAESAKEIAAVAEEVVPEPVVEPVQRGLTLPPNELTDDVPFCSGALPVKPKATAPEDVVASFPSAEGEKLDEAVVEEKKPHS